MVPEKLEHRVITLIKELRNERNVQDNWPAFNVLIETNIGAILENTPTRWLISICDTFIDYADKDRAKNSLALSVFMNMIRFGETVKFVRPCVDENKLKETYFSPIMLENGHNTFAIQRQDVFLNLTRRIIKTIADDQIVLAIFKELLSRIHSSENVITDFSRRSEVKDRYFPLDPDEMKDNYGR